MQSAKTGRFNNNCLSLIRRQTAVNTTERQVMERAPASFGVTTALINLMDFVF